MIESTISMSIHNNTDGYELLGRLLDNQRDSHSYAGPTGGANLPRSRLINSTSSTPRKTYLGLLFLWFWTVVFAVLLVIVIKVYEAKGVLTKWQKDTYNFITTGLIFFLGLSFYVRVKLTCIFLTHTSIGSLQGACQRSLHPP